MTTADQIRSMDDETLADYILQIKVEAMQYAFKALNITPFDPSMLKTKKAKNKLLAILKREAGMGV